MIEELRKVFPLVHFCPPIGRLGEMVKFTYSADATRGEIKAGCVNISQPLADAVAAVREQVGDEHYRAAEQERPRSAPTLYVRESIGATEQYRLATPEEIGATRYAVEMGDLAIRAGRIRIESDPNAGGPLRFLVGRDFTVYRDDAPVGFGGRLVALSLTIRPNEPVRVWFEIEPN